MAVTMEIDFSPLIFYYSRTIQDSLTSQESFLEKN